MTAPARIARAHPLTLRDRRAALEAAIAAAIEALDAMDGDADLEPSRGSVAAERWSDQRRWAQGAHDDREEACEGEGEGRDEACLNLELHDQRRLGTYAGEALDLDDDPGEVVVRCEAGLC